MKTSIKNTMTICLTALLITISMMKSASAEHRCSHCGCACECQKVCRLVAEQKKVTSTCWGTKTEEFCIPGPSKPGCRHCETICDEGNDPKAPCAKPKKFVWTEWIPSCTTTLHSKTKLMKKTVTKTIPSYKWVVEDLCPHCESNCQLADILPDAQIPPAPIANAKLLYGEVRPTSVHVDERR